MTFYEWTAAIFASVSIWLTGETGRVIAAGGAGGILRWVQGEKRRLRDGVLAAGTGALCAMYLWPAVFSVMGWAFGALEPSTANVGMAAFLAGASGMSLVKVLTAAIETAAKRGGGGDA